MDDSLESRLRSQLPSDGRAAQERFVRLAGSACEVAPVKQTRCQADALQGTVYDLHPMKKRAGRCGGEGSERTG